MSSAAGNRAQYTLDAVSRITSKTQFIADDPGVASNYTTRYGYGSAGELSQISYPSGLKIYYRRNASGQITGIDSQQPGADKPIVPFLSELANTALGQPRSHIADRLQPGRSRQPDARRRQRL